MSKRKANPQMCIILSDTDEEEEDDDDDDEEEATEYEDDEEEEEMSSSSCSSDEDSEAISGDDEEEEEEEYEDEEEDCREDGESGDLGSDSIYERTVGFMRKGGCDLETLKVEECKVYLRKHGLRLTGNKEECIQRIKEHWRMKDGNGEKLYPRSSFSINCTGDVCKGDVVLFTQKVYGKFDKVTRSGGLLGKRTVAGKVIKESYGTVKQQHTFTVEVLWSKGVKQLQPLHPLLVKGRNLYRLRTYRQRWKNEAERSKILAEKHKRGAAARGLRARKKACSAKYGSKRKRHSQHTGRSPKRRKSQDSGSIVRSERENYDGGQGNNRKPNKSDKRKVPTPSIEHLRPSHANEKGIHMRHTSSVNSHQLQNHPINDVSTFHANRRASYSYTYDVGSTSSAIRAPIPGHYSSTTAVPVNFRHDAYAIPSNYVDPRSLYYNQNQAAFDRQVYSVPSGSGQYSGRVGNLLHCATPGCRNLQTKHCVTFSCGGCCRRIGRRCHVH